MTAQKITKIVKSYLCNQCLFVLLKKPVESGDVNSPLGTVGASSHDNDVMIPCGSSNMTFLLGKSTEKISTPLFFNNFFSQLGQFVRLQLSEGLFSKQHNRNEQRKH